MTDPQPLDQLPRIEDFRADYTREQILSAEALNTRAIAMQAYLQAFPAFLHMRQLTEFIQGRQYFAPTECPLGGWVLMRELATPKTTTVSPNVDTLYGASYLLLDQQGPVVLERAADPWTLLLGGAPGCLLQQLRHCQPPHLWQRRRRVSTCAAGMAGQPPTGIRAVLCRTDAGDLLAATDLHAQPGRIRGAARLAGHDPTDAAGSVACKANSVSRRWTWPRTRFRHAHGARPAAIL